MRQKTVIAEISPKELKSMLESKEDFFLIDVRESEEYEEGHILRALLIPLQTLVAKIKGIKKDKPIVLYCHMGPRSRAACEILQELGHTNVKVLKGGFEGWCEQE
ncbi:MAG: rhodanese-like domain-containing protein [Patescibacteria group bacterium]